MTNSAYRTFANKRGSDIELAGCWAHARRKFNDALEGGDSKQRAAWVLRQLQYLYRIESELKDSRAAPRQRESKRGSASRPIVDRVIKALRRFKASRQHLPKSLMGKAIDYTLNHEAELRVYLDNANVGIDNNLCYAARGITGIMPPPDLCRAHKLEAHIPFVCHSIPYSHAA